jgi:hypothetical protein
VILKNSRKLEQLQRIRGVVGRTYNEYGMGIYVKHSYELINFALQKSQYKSLVNKQQVTYIGEGAWHHAYLVKQNSGEKLVLRFPKEIAYGKKVAFIEKDINAEYGGTKL